MVKGDFRSKYHIQSPMGGRVDFRASRRKVAEEGAEAGAARARRIVIQYLNRQLAYALDNKATSMRFRAEAEKALVEALIGLEWTELEVGVLPAEETLRH